MDDFNFKDRGGKLTIPDKVEQKENVQPVVNEDENGSNTKSETTNNTGNENSNKT